MSNDQKDPAAEYQQVVESVAKGWASEYASMPTGDFRAHKRALELAEKQRDDDGKKKAGEYHKRLAQMSSGEFARRSQFNDWSDLG